MLSPRSRRFFACVLPLVSALGCQRPATVPDEHGFSYVCGSKPKADPSCDEIPGVAASSAQVPLPDKWAVGSLVRVDYWARSTHGSAGVPVKVYSDTLDKLAPETSVTGGFRVLAKGSVALVALGPEQEVLGRVRVDAHDIDHIGFDRYTTEGAQNPGDQGVTRVKIDRIGDSTVIRGVPMDAEGQVLAGDLPCKWSTSDEAVVAIRTPTNDNMITVTATGAGSASLRLELGKIAVDLPIQVSN
jgi:hypothetical protein